jgi:hypothetical protein
LIVKLDMLDISLILFVQMNNSPLLLIALLMIVDI